MYLIYASKLDRDVLNGCNIFIIISVDTLRKILRSLVLAALITAVAASAAIAVVTGPVFAEDGFGYTDIPVRQMRLTRRIYDAEGNELYHANGYGRIKVDVQNLHDYTQNAFIAIEDARFYSHDGFDVRRIAAAAVKDLLSFSAKEGASTITQQLVKNVWLTPEKTLSRKIKELSYARKLEETATKKEILGMYLNSLYFGDGVYGIANAAKRFFDKSAEQLTIGESAMLAAIINNPGAYNPYRHNTAAEKRKRLVLSRMLDMGFISKKEFEDASPITPLSNKRINDGLFVSYSLNESGNEIYTDYSSSAQSALTCALETAQIPDDVTVAAVVVNSRTERIVAAASNTYEDLSDIRRQPGSTIKPLVCYAPALDDGIISPVTPLLDEPVKFGSYSPRNYLGRYYGWATATECLSRSLNVPAVKLLNIIGVDNAKRYASKYGLNFSENDKGLAIALGGTEKGENLLTMARAYCKFASYNTVAVKKETAYLINSMLGECARTGTAKALASVANVAAKTGTVGGDAGNTDAYCIAYNPGYVVAVWAGNKNGYLPDGVTGGTLPAYICAETLKRPVFDSGAFEKPDTVVDIDINADELYKKHKVVRADTETLPKDRITAEFSIYNMPDGSADEDLFFGDYENFRVIDGFVD